MKALIMKGASLTLFESTPYPQQRKRETACASAPNCKNLYGILYLNFGNRRLAAGGGERDTIYRKLKAKGHL